MGEWIPYNLGELIEVKNGYAFKSDDFDDFNGTPVIKIKNVASGELRMDDIKYYPHKIEGLEDFIISKNDILIALTGSHVNQPSSIVGKVARYTRDEISLLNQRVGKIYSLDERVTDEDYIYWFFKQWAVTLELALNAGGSANQANISGKLIKTLELELPPLPEQKAIASVLSSLDDKIDLLHRQNKTLEAMAETLFRQWFVEPIMQAERDDDKAEGFQNGKFDIWIETTVGGDWGKENSTGDFVVPVYCIRGTDIAALNKGIPEKTPVRYVKKKKFESIEPHEGDIIIEISGGTEKQSTGRTTYINSDIESLFQLPLIFSNFCRLLRIKKKKYSYFVYSYLQYLYKEDEFFSLENGSSGIKNLDYKALLFELDYPMPQESIVVEFDEEVKDYFKKINQNKSQIRTLEKLRDTLLPKLMSGAVKVKV